MRFLLTLAFLLVSAPAWAEDTGTLKLRFVYGGQAFEPAALKPDKDVEFCGKHDLVNERLLVNPDNKGIKNVVLYVYTGRGGSKLPDQPESDKTHELANDKCRFEPRVVFVQVGDTLKITNPDDVGHNANVNFFNNKAVNPTIPPKGEVSVKIEKPEPAVIPVDCNIHPWMRAYVLALDHPFAAVSDADGNIEIKDLPAGEKLAFRIYHEAAEGAIPELKVNGDTQQLRRNVWEIEIKAGENDLGDVTVPAMALKP